MGSENTDMLERVYRNRIGDPNTGDEVYGYWLFVIGLVAGILGIILFLLSESSADMTRGAGIMLGSLGLLLLIAGPIIRLELRRLATYLTYAGSVVGAAAIAWFLVAYPDNWVRGAGQAEAIIAIYAVGLGLIAAGGVGVPLVGGRSAAELEAELAEEQDARERAETETETERAARASAEATAESEKQAREAVEDELSRIRDSQSQFELYEDKAGEYRWRLRHRNTNVIATSGEGYSARRKAQQGLAGVKRDAYGASVVDLERMDVDVDDVEDATEGDDAVEYAPDTESQATFEQYEDNAGEYRWRLRHDNGEIIGDGGEGYSSKRNLDNAVERVRHYVTPADYLAVDPVAFELYTDNAHEWRWRLVHENGQTLADGGEGYSSRSKARQGIESVRTNAPEGGKADFEVYEDARRKYRWRLTHTNGNIIADSGQGYASENGAEEAVERVQNYAPDAPHLDIGTAAFEIYEDAGEEWRWRLRSRNGNTLADSGEGYGSRRRAEEAVVRVKRHAPGADAGWQ
jgi:uncharacterized protein YegP (UPF0339 family)